MNKRYPNSNLCYDFCVKLGNVMLYLELCGDYDTEEYVQRQFLKKDQFNSILVGYRSINKFIKDISNGTFNSQNVYY